MSILDKAKDAGKSLIGGSSIAGGIGTSFLGDALGFGASGDIADATKQQVAFDRKAMRRLRKDLAPFRNLLSPEEMQGTVDLAVDPQAQLSFLQSNPLFNNLLQQSQDAIMANQAARGGLASGGTQAALQNAFLAQGQDLINQQLNRSMPLLSNMQNAATQTGVGSANILSGIGAAKSAGTIAQSNADQQAFQNLISLGSMFVNPTGGQGGQGGSFFG